MAPEMKCDCARFDSPLRRREDGQAMIEFALIMPVLMLLVVGIIKLGVVYSHYITLTDAVRVGARQLSLSRGYPTDPCAAAVTRTINAANTLNLTAGQITATPSPPDQCAPSGISLQGSSVTLSATYPCELGIFGINIPCNLRASATESVE